MPTKEFAPIRNAFVSEMVTCPQELDKGVSLDVKNYCTLRAPPELPLARFHALTPIIPRLVPRKRLRIAHVNRGQLNSFAVKSVVRDFSG